MKLSNSDVYIKTAAWQAIKIAMFVTAVLLADSWFKQGLAAYNAGNKEYPVSLYQMTLVCQQLDATTTNPHWDYKACLGNLEDSLKAQPEHNVLQG